MEASDFGAGLPVAWIRVDDSYVRHYGFRENASHVSLRERRLKSGEVVELDDTRRLDGIHRRPDIAAARAGDSIDEGDETFVYAAVIAVVVNENFLTAGDFARDANGKAIRVGGRERELPEWEAEAARECFANPESVFRGEH